ncbi:aminoglycoside 6-adenylyltransferase [Actinomadura rugatobispora]|uniref:Aminoglycoside 6-adenylyltransferase n=1 Tax=Actinomadura rugatobispora TaxID=1994 RepID=A0ABW1A229_9ACTN|nr:hypothetical protein GCM10010200_042090 [Actinomadura rugatobispora]
MEDPEALRAAIVAWARNDVRVEAVVQTGSRARGTGVDAFSDLDVEIIGRGWRELFADVSWSGAFGRVLVSVSTTPEEFAEERATRLVVYGGGRKVDFTLAGPERLEGFRREGLDDLYERGHLVLLDKTGVTEGLPAATGAAPVPRRPGREEFDHAVAEFWFEATQVPIYLARGDLWVVKFRDTTMKEFLLDMLQWYAAVEGAADVWHIGHRMDQWLPEHIWKALQETYGRFDAADGWRALRATNRVFAEVAEVVAERCGFASCAGLAEDVGRLVDAIERRAREGSF